MHFFNLTFRIRDSFQTNIIKILCFEINLIVFIPFFQANWFRANQYCRYHGMHLASISSQEENDKLETYIRDFGKYSKKKKSNPKVLIIL